MSFEGEVHLLTLQKSEILFIYFRLKRFLKKYFRVCYRLVHYLPMLISHSNVLASFCFKTSLIHFDNSIFFYLFSIFFSCFVLQVVRSSASPLCKKRS